jgi:hypothetical protein
MRRLLSLGSFVVIALVTGGVAIGVPGDITPPDFNPTPDITAEATSPDGAIVPFTVTATDPTEPPPGPSDPVTVSCLPSGGSQFALGVTPVSCTAHDAEGIAATPTDGAGLFDVLVVDTTPPVFGTPSGTTAADVTPPIGEEVVFYSIAATDIVDPMVDVQCDPASGGSFEVGATPVECTATDDSEGVATTSFSVTVGPAPNTPPVLSLPTTITAEATSGSGAVVAYAALVSASDVEDDPDPIPSCGPPASGSTFPVGTTQVNCTVIDSGGQDASGSFDVLVEDTTPPDVTVPASMTVQPTGPDGATVTFAASASDLVSGAVATACAPLSGTLFPLGITLVTCTATDAAGNVGSNSFSISVQDAEAPVVTVPGSKTVEANGPGGAIVNYEAPTAVDVVDGPIAPPDIRCTKPSGALFPLGTTFVTCSATDSGGRAGGATFAITVEDTTPPVLTAPASVTIQSTTAVAVADPRIRDFLEAATATDIVDQDVDVTTNAPASFPLGTTQVVFSAEDDSGNTAEKSATVTITTRPVAPPAAADTTPPGNVRGVRAVAGNLSVAIAWRPPAARDFHHVTITRVPGNGQEPESLVYQGRKTSFVARGLEDGVEYRFVIVAYDRAGNRAAGVAVVVLAQRQNLLAPLNGETIRAPRRFAWRAVEGADYYNIQFWRNGKRLSAWPVKAQFVLRSSWRFEGKVRRLAPGTWRVFVWPGFGDKADADYGELHVDATFVVRRR